MLLDCFSQNVHAVLISLHLSEVMLGPAQAVKNIPMTFVTVKLTNHFLGNALKICKMH